MNRSKIEWCDHTWNPITGCLHGCEYCYARKMTARFSGDIRINKMCAADYRLEEESRIPLYILDEPMMNETGNKLVYPFGFEPTLHKYRFDTLDNLKMGNNIFVGAMADVFGEWVPDGWLDMVFKECAKRPQHNYLFLTKNVDRYSQYGVPTQGHDNYWYGISVTRESEMHKFNSLPAFGKTFISFEPLLEDLQPERHDILFKTVDWIIIGAETGKRKDRVIARFEWVKKLVLAADNHGIPVFMKDSLIDIVGEKNMRRDFPEELKKKTISKKLRNKLYDACCECGAVNKKSDMYTLLARRERGVQPKQYGFMCDKCFEGFCKEKGLEVPKNRKMED